MGCDIDMYVYIIRNISDELVGWSTDKNFINKFIKDRKFTIPVYIEKEKESELEKTPFFHVHDEDEIIKFKGCIVRYDEYKEVIDNLYYSQSEYIDKLNEIKAFINSFKLEKAHSKLINKGLELLENYIIASNFIDIIKVKPFIKEYIKSKRR